MILQYFGHSCFLLETDGTSFLFDPFFTGNPKANGALANQVQCDYICITHGHGDHIGDTIAIHQRTKAPVISNYEIVSWLENQNVSGIGMNFGGKVQLKHTIVKYITASHSSRLPDGTYGGNPGGFLIWNSEGCIYIAGDTAVHADMAIIPKIAPPLTCAILPVGDFYTMGYEDALVAAEMIQCKKIIGCHFDTFEGITIDHAKAKTHFASKGYELILPHPESKWEFN